MYTFTIFRKACFPGRYYTGKSIAAAEKTTFFKKTKKKKAYRIMIWPARPLDIENFLETHINKLCITLRSRYWYNSCPTFGQSKARGCWWCHLFFFAPCASATYRLALPPTPYSRPQQRSTAEHVGESRKARYTALLLTCQAARYSELCGSHLRVFAVDR